MRAIGRAESGSKFSDRLAEGSRRGTGSRRDQLQSMLHNRIGIMGSKTRQRSCNAERAEGQDKVVRS